MRKINIYGNMGIREYKKIFCQKYSFYSLMRRIYYWFEENKNDDERIMKGYEEFKYYCVKEGKEDFDFSKLWMFFSNEFIEKNFFTKIKSVKTPKGKTKKKSSGYSNKLMKDRNINIMEGTAEENRDKMSLQTNSFESIFVISRDSKVLKQYVEQIKTNDEVEKECNRIIDLINKWFVDAEIKKRVVDEVIEKYYLQKKFAALPPKNNREIDYTSFIYTKEDFFIMLDVILNNRFVQKEEKVFSYEDFKENLNINLEIETSTEREFNERSREEILQKIIDISCKDNKILSLNDGNIAMVSSDMANYTGYSTATAVKNRFEQVKNINIDRYLANMFITSLCVSRIDEILKFVWNMSISAETGINITKDNSIRKCLSVINDPFTSNNKVVETLLDLHNVYCDSYKTDLCFLNILIYNNWEVLRKQYTEIEDRFELLKSCYNFVVNLKIERREEYFKEYVEFGKNKYLRDTLLQYINEIVENHINDEYCEIDDTVDILQDIMDEISFMKLQAKLYMFELTDDDSDFYSRNLEQAYKLYKDYFNETKDYSVISNILECITLIEKEGEMSTEETELLNSMWRKVKSQAGDYNEIIKIYRDDCIKKLENRKHLIENSGNIGFRSAFSEKNYYEYDLENANKEIFVVLGMGKKSEAFINSLSSDMDYIVYLVAQRTDIFDLKKLIDKYRGKNIQILEGGITTIFEKLEVYNLDTMCLENENAFEEYLRNINKIHIVALGDNKRENIKNVVEVIETTWQHYVLYEYMVDHCSKFNIKIDFKELDIVVDAYEYETAYIDSIMNRLDQDFYIKIRYVNYEKEIAKELITEYPLFLADIQEAKLDYKIQNPSKIKNTRENVFIPGDTMHNIVILACNEKTDVICEIIKNLIRVSGFVPVPDGLGQYDSSNFSYYEGKIGNNYKLTVFAENTKLIKQKLEYDAPDIFSNRSYLHNVEPAFIDMSPESYDLYKMFYGGDEVISRILREATYFVCVMKDDSLSYKVATKIRQMCYRIDKSMKHVPIIVAMAENGFIDMDYNMFRVAKDEETIISCNAPWWSSLDIYSFGSFERCFSFDNLYNNYINVIAWKMHVTDKTGDTYLKKIVSYYKNYYNFMACEQRAITVPYMFFSVLYKEMCNDCTLKINDTGNVLNNNWSIKKFEDNIGRYVRAYNDKVKVKDSNGQFTASLESNVILWLAILEKNRFNVNLTLEGYTSTIYEAENKEAFFEYIAGWKSRSVNVLKDKLHIAKLHGDITNWEYSKGKKYDSIYARDLAMYIDRDVDESTE